MRGYTVRFSVGGVWNQSDPFRTEDAAGEYAEHLARRGGVEVGNIAPTDVKRESHFVDR